MNPKQLPEELSPLARRLEAARSIRRYAYWVLLIVGNFALLFAIVHWYRDPARSAGSGAEAPSALPAKRAFRLSPEEVSEFFRRLSAARPGDIVALCKEFEDFHFQLSDQMWGEIDGAIKFGAEHHLRLAAALAQLDPTAAEWNRIASQVVEELLSASEKEFDLWINLLRPAAKCLLPKSSDIADQQYRSQKERLRVLTLYAEYASDKPQALAYVVVEAVPTQFRRLVEQLGEFGQRGLEHLSFQISEKRSTFGRELSPERLARRRGNGVVASFLLGDDSRSWWTSLAASPDPSLRTYLIQSLASLGVPVANVVDKLAPWHEDSIRQAALLSLGERHEAADMARERASLLPRVQAIYRKDPDSGVHAAAEWLLRHWSAESWLQAEIEQWKANKAARDEKLQLITKSLLKPRASAERQWYVNGQGQTVVVISGPVDFRMGSPVSESWRRDDEVQHKRRIDRSFALAAAPVTREQFLRFMPNLASGDLKRFPAPTCPMGGILWAEAAAYCNWLSKEEGIPQDQWCYEVVGEELRAKDNCLRLSGYRLPTEAEVEYTTRAGTATSRYFGEAVDYLPKYAWFEANSQDRTWPVGTLMPNDFGFFDMLGNIYIWCHECYRPYPEPNEWGVVEDNQMKPTGDITDRIALRGGAYFNQAATLRCATRYATISGYRNDFHGLRVARTMAP